MPITAPNFALTRNSKKPKFVPERKRKREQSVVDLTNDPESDESSDGSSDGDDIIAAHRLSVKTPKETKQKNQMDIPKTNLKKAKTLKMPKKKAKEPLYVGSDDEVQQRGPTTTKKRKLAEKTVLRDIDVSEEDEAEEIPAPKTQKKKNVTKQSHRGRVDDGVQELMPYTPRSDGRASVELGRPLREMPTGLETLNTQDSDATLDGVPVIRPTDNPKACAVEDARQQMLNEHRQWSHQIHQRLFGGGVSSTTQSNDLQGHSPEEMEEMRLELHQLRGRATNMEKQQRADAAWSKATNHLLMEAYDSIVERMDECIMQLERARERDRRASELRFASLEQRLSDAESHPRRRRKGPVQAKGGRYRNRMV